MEGVDLVKQSRGIGTGSVQFVTITDGGSGYTTTPTVTFSNPLLDNVFCDSDEIMTLMSLPVDNTDIPGEETSKSFECHQLQESSLEFTLLTVV